MDIEKNVWDEYIRFKETCRNNRIFPECSFITHLLEKLSCYEKVLYSGSVLYRARTYQNNFFDLWFDYMKRIHDDIEHGEQILQEMSIAFEKIKAVKEAGFNGYDATGSFVNPDPKSIGGGRCNHVNEQCLYVSEDIQTAISELKPLIREEISVACIQLREDLKIVDFGFDSSEDPYQKLISFLFVTSPTQDDYDIYTYTQVLCSLIKKAGYDGIKYTSCQDLSKTNYVIFNYDKCKAVSSDVYAVNSISYGFIKK